MSSEINGWKRGGKSAKFTMKKVGQFHSIKKQLPATFIVLITATLLACLFINNVFLESYYMANKEKTLVSAYKSINDCIKNGMGTDEFSIKLQQICSKGNISIYAMDADGNAVLSSTNEMDNKILQSRLFGYVFSLDDHENDHVLAETNSYKMLKTNDRTMQMGYVEMFGLFTNGNWFIMRTPLESIRESVAISNRFLIYIGFAAILISAVVIWFLSRRITEPILELTDISGRMARLDFDVKYTSGGKNEISILGRNFNHLSETLEQTISELKTANNELLKDIEKKEQIDEMRKEFLSNVSHELKTPIALIQGYAEGLKEGIDEDEESRDFYCEVIMDEAGKMNQMVKKLLTLNQLEFGNDTVTMERFDLTAMIQGILQSTSILAEQKDVRILFAEKEPAYVWADEFKTEEVFTNYLSNALNHADGERIIEVKLERRKADVRVSVFNTGKPIPEEDVDKIWTKFYKVDKARTRAYGGSGVGLSIVKAIMDSFHKECGVINYDNGVEFWFDLDYKVDVK